MLGRLDSNQDYQSQNLARCRVTLRPTEPRHGIGRRLGGQRDGRRALSSENAPLTDTGIRARTEGDVAVVALARPPHNFLDEALLRALADELEARARECRAIVLASDGRSFSGGGSFAPARGAPPAADPGEAFRLSAGRIYEQGLRIFAIERPIVAAVQGAAIGAGLGLALACDLRVASTDAFFAGNFVRLGIHPGFAVSETLPALVGPGRAADLLLTGRRVDAAEALRIGLVDRVAPAAELLDAAIALAGEVAAAAPLAVAATRATLRLGLAERARAALAREIEEQVRLITTADAAEGIRAVFEKREPRFEGR